MSEEITTGQEFRFNVGDNVEGFDCGGFYGIGIVKSRHEEEAGFVYDVVFYDYVIGKVVEEPFLEHDLNPMKYKAPDNHWLYEWEDETSSSDPAGKWNPGSDCSIRLYRIWVPNSIGKNDQDAISEYIESQGGIPDKWVS